MWIMLDVNIAFIHKEYKQTYMHAIVLCVQCKYVDIYSIYKINRITYATIYQFCCAR